MLRYMYVSHLF